MLYQPIGNYSASPYYLEELGVGIHTIEELSFYLKENATTLEEGIMKLQLCSFIKKELGLKELGDVLTELVESKGSLASFVRLILEESGFVSEEEMRSIDALLRKKSALGAGERRKSHGDYHLYAGRYLMAGREYRLALEQTDRESDRQLYAALEHNLGCAMAGMFLYSQAAEHFKLAYELGHEEKSYLNYLAAIRLGGSRRDYALASRTHELDGDRARLVERSIKDAAQEEDAREMILAEILEALDEGDDAAFEKKAGAFISELQREYRGNMCAE